MFDDLQSDRLLKRALAARLGDMDSLDSVVEDLLAKHDFGHGLFHKILSKSVLKPQPVRAMAAPASQPASH